MENIDEFVVIIPESSEKIPEPWSDSWEQWKALFIEIVTDLLSGDEGFLVGDA